MDGEKDVAPRCRLSDPAHPHNLCRRDNPRPSLCFRCGPKGETDEDHNYNDWYYYCDICKLAFHEECNMFPQGTRHPYHPNHPMYLTVRFSETRIQSFNNDETEILKLLMGEPMYDENIVLETKNACHWCGKDLGRMFFRCVDCDFSLDINCLMEEPLFTITNSETHQHPLTLFPRPLIEPCSACGLSGNNERGYACDPCNYIVHERCIHPPLVTLLSGVTHESVDIQKDVSDGEEIDELKEV